MGNGNKDYKFEKSTDKHDFGDSSCPLCLSKSIYPEVLFSKPGVYAAAGCLDQHPGGPTHFSNLSLRQCCDCGLVFNESFDEQAMVHAYSSSAYLPKSVVSEAMSAYKLEVVREIRNFIDRKSRILDIGSGTGELADKLSDYAGEVVTVDPSDASQSSFESKKIQNRRHVKSEFNNDVAESFHETGFEFISAQQFLEHYADPHALINRMDRCCNPNGIIYIEVPNAANIISSARFCDLFHDHFAYYTSDTLSNYFDCLGYKCIKKVFLLNEQLFGIFFMKSPGAETGPPRNYGYKILDFSDFYSQIEKFNHLLRGVNSAVIWGAGSQGMALQQYCHPDLKGRISAFVDKDPNKVGRYAQDTGAKILYPDNDILREADMVVISAVLYQDEIRNSLRNELGYTRTIIGLRDGVEELE